MCGQRPCQDQIAGLRECLTQVTETLQAVDQEIKNLIDSAPSASKEDILKRIMNLPEVSLTQLAGNKLSPTDSNFFSLK